MDIVCRRSVLYQIRRKYRYIRFFFFFFFTFLYEVFHRKLFTDLLSPATNSHFVTRSAKPENPILTEYFLVHVCAKKALYIDQRLLPQDRPTFLKISESRAILNYAALDWWYLSKCTGTLHVENKFNHFPPVKQSIHGLGWRGEEDREEVTALVEITKSTMHSIN